jgi:hypothetical protein
MVTLRFHVGDAGFGRARRMGGQMPRRSELGAPHSQVHPGYRHRLDPVQDLQPPGIGLAIRGLTVGSPGAPPEGAAEP